MASTGEKVQIWDEHGKDVDPESAEAWDTWEKCSNAPGFPKGLVKFLSDSERGCGFAEPTPIQSYSWPALVTGKDFIGIARTGSGKTLAFLLPAFMWLKKNKKSDSPVDCSKGPAVMVLTPTRELCYQIYADAEKFGNPVKISAACAYGGAPKWEQEQRFKEGPEVLIATPGRLADFTRTEVLNLSQVRFITLDEADRMLDMGFEPQVKEILDWCPAERQVSMFTATWPSGIRSLADTYIKNPTQVQIGSTEVMACADVTQHIEVLDSANDKTDALKRVIEKTKGNVLVFCNTKRKCSELAWDLGDKAVELHGDLKQSQRDEAMRQFREGEKSVLIATDVASRGLDVRSISCVVNYDAPNNCGEDYIHRIGRTGRAGDKGDAYTFLCSGDDKQAAAIMAIMENGNITPPESLRSLAKGTYGGGGSSGGWGNKEESWDKKDEGGDDNWKKDDAWDKKDDSWSGDKRKADDSWESSDAKKW